jgi:anaerobic selenocysteine-containing dehydrogenase
VTTSAGTAETTVEVTDSMLPGHVSLPTGQGLDYPDSRGVPVLTGVAANELTSLQWRDPLAGTPWHKHVPARVEAA